MIDLSKEAAADEKFLMEPAHIEAFEAQHGRIPDGAWVLMRTDWSKRTDPALSSTCRRMDRMCPARAPAAVRFLVEPRGQLGFGVEAVGTDAGQGFISRRFFRASPHARRRQIRPAMPPNLDQLPPTGAVLIPTPLKIARGSGSPLRVLALAPA